uniref:Nodule cysteine-rich protein 8 n=1 Tax=Cicer arietinum TaxID=3827 RepID=A0A0U8RBJ6_CICAR|nr:TPA_exp: nodule cysteine-rich protein 8 [Cicer arietinum]
MTKFFMFFFVLWSVFLAFVVSDVSAKVECENDYDCIRLYPQLLTRCHNGECVVMLYREGVSMKVEN